MIPSNLLLLLILLISFKTQLYPNGPVYSIIMMIFKCKALFSQKCIQLFKIITKEPSKYLLSYQINFHLWLQKVKIGLNVKNYKIKMVRSAHFKMKQMKIRNLRTIYYMIMISLKIKTKMKLLKWESDQRQCHQ